jgi:translation initiation factor 2 alpha subunit (eIF-2alpha)
LKLQKWKEEKEKLQKWKEEKQRHKLLKKASEKPVFKCGIVHHKVGSPYLNDISNMNYTKRAMKMSSMPAKCEGQKVIHKSCTLKTNAFTDNKERSFAPPNFKFKVFVLLAY